MSLPVFLLFLSFLEFFFIQFFIFFNFSAPIIFITFYRPFSFVFLHFLVLPRMIYIFIFNHSVSLFIPCHFIASMVS